MAITKKMPMSNKGLKHRLMIAFSLMAVIPLLACVYALSPYLVPTSHDITNLAAIILASVVISFMGLLLANNIIKAVVGLASDVKEISNGDYDRSIDLQSDDELGALGQSINAMTSKIRSNLDELKKYGQSVKAINADIQKKVAVLSSLLRIDEVISAGSMQIDSLLEFGLGKASDIFDMGFGALYVPREDGGDYIAKVCYNINDEKLTDIVIKPGIGPLGRVIETRKTLQVVEGMKLPGELDEFKRSHNLKNFVAIPLHSDRTVFGLLVLGNRLSDFSYTKDDIDLAAVFAKHITIAIESDLLERRNRELATTDDLTGLYNKRYVLIQLEEEIKRAIFYQRPCSFIVFRIDNFNSFRDAHGELALEDALKRVAKIMQNSNMLIAKAARIGGNEFAVLLPEKNKKEASHIAEDMRKKIENAIVVKTSGAALLVAAGVSENPIDGTTSDELFKKAITSLARPVDGVNKHAAT